MEFTVGDVYRRAILLAPEVQRSPPTPETIARFFTDILADLIADVMDMDEERLARSYTVPADVVDEDPIDLTDDGVGGSGTREWLRIIYIDWVGSDGTDGEVAVPTLEARHRARREYAGHVVGYLEDEQRLLRKVTGWDGVDTLKVHGVLVPVAPDAADLDGVGSTYDFPRSIYSALRWELLLELGSLRSEDIRPEKIGYWENKRGEARQRLMMDAQDFALNRIDDIGL